LWNFSHTKAVVTLFVTVVFVFFTLLVTLLRFPVFFKAHSVYQHRRWQGLVVHVTPSGFRRAFLASPCVFLTQTQALAWAERTLLRHQALMAAPLLSFKRAPVHVLPE
jgi:hypothetical protein